MISALALPKETPDDFIRSAKEKLGEYKLSNSKKNDPRCSEGGLLTLVDVDNKQGIRLGHNIFIGPFSPQGDITESKEYCKITNNLSFTSNSVTEVTELSKCPKEAKGDESKSTKSLKFEKNQVLYQIKETNFHCVYEKIGKN